ncbi:methionine aminopeptidase 1 [Cyclospora cayetanensis]|uniref:Methionine aminopeptidase 1 n=1 Tax=Cyclospora cayetanensis TaxID=88456 RepID=A0A6P6S165_9EIME|nr:methionine aminopeptidase 1 [Cyclospora cayetanensis]
MQSAPSPSTQEASSSSSGASGASSTEVCSAACAAAQRCQGCGVSAGEGSRFLSCPKCVDLNISPNVFCSQECFKANWSSHKRIHEVMRLLLAERERDKEGNLSHLSPSNYDPHDQIPWKRDPHLRAFISYKFTGPLRPWPISPRRTVPSCVPLPDYAATGVPLGEQAMRSNAIRVHTPEEIERLRASCLLGREALDLAHSLIRPGVTAEEIDKAVHEFICSRGAYPSPLNYQGFPKSCCISVNEVICHGIPDHRPLQEGDVVNVDITVFYQGMHGDLNETYICTGSSPASSTSSVPSAAASPPSSSSSASEDSRRLLQGAYLSLMEAVKACKPGMMYRDIGRIVSSVADQHGLSVVRSYCGHGIGELFHTAPSIPHYRNNKAVGILKPGHVFTIEPMLNLGKPADVLWPDNWTAVTLDGSLSAQFEHTLLCTEEGVEILTKRLPSSPKLDIDTHGSLPLEISHKWGLVACTTFGWSEEEGQRESEPRGRTFGPSATLYRGY